MWPQRPLGRVTAITRALSVALADDALGFALMGRQVDETGLEGRRSDAEHTKLVDASQPELPTWRADMTSQSP